MEKKRGHSAETREREKEGEMDPVTRRDKKRARLGGLEEWEN